MKITYDTNERNVTDPVREVPPRTVVTFKFDDGTSIDVAARQQADGQMYLNITGSTYIEIRPTAANLVRVRPVRD